MYKKSQFNYYVNNEKEYLLYNTLYNSLARLSKTEYLQYEQLDKCEEGLKVSLIEHGFWVNNNVDEYRSYLRYANLLTNYSERKLNITITTTLRCNARCDYCYETGLVQKDFPLENAKQILEFIKTQNHSNGVNLIWFGGEPLMNTVLIDEVTSLLETQCISYTSYIITNGSLLNEKIINTKMQIWHVNNIQITLDGTEEEYERRKNYKNKGEGNYYNILQSIRNLAEENVCVHLRLNIDRKNANNILKLIEELELYFGKYENVTFYPAFITGINDAFSENEYVMYIKKMLKRLKNPQKLSVSSKLHSLPKIHSCMNVDPCSFTIDTMGNVFTCEQRVGHSEYAIGNIENGLFSKDTRIMAQALRNECLKCVFLPKCMGGCESNYLVNENPCMIEKYIIMAYLEYLLE